MRKRISLKETGLFFIIVAIVILVFLLFGGRSWMSGPTHGLGNNGNNQMEMESNPE